MRERLVNIYTINDQVYHHTRMALFYCVFETVENLILSTSPTHTDNRVGGLVRLPDVSPSAWGPSCLV